MKAIRKPLGLAILVTFLIELIVFNFPFLRTLFEHPVSVPFEYSEGLIAADDGITYYVQDPGNVYLQVDGCWDDTGYVSVDVSYHLSESITAPLKITVTAVDEGHALGYKIGVMDTWKDFTESMYFRPNFYGKLSSLHFSLNPSEGTTLKITGITFHNRVPFHTSVIRLFVLITVLTFILWYCSIKKVSEIRLCEKRKLQRKIICLFLAFNVCFQFALVSLNTNQHKSMNYLPFNQYALLAESLSQGNVTIEPSNKDELLQSLDGLENPYDKEYRIQQTGIRTPDIAYYNNDLYVYFGIVPELVFYFPYYLITGSHFSTWIAMFISAVMLLTGAYFMLHCLISRNFPDTPFVIYLVLATLLGNGIGSITMLLMPYFYSLPILLGLAFTFWGLGFWLRSATNYENHTDGNYCIAHAQLFWGSLCMALVAGCRPQLVVGSFFIFPIFWLQIAGKNRQPFVLTIKKILIGILPYLIVAFGLMYYNQIRFGSPFDFGANYNVTSNDMTKRGFNLGRISDGLYMYLWQLPVITNVFPYLRSIYYVPTYLGETIYESMYGGVLFTHPLLLLPFTSRHYLDGLRKKGLLGWVWLSTGFALLIVILDTEMSGILPRYYNDFLWLLFLPLTIIFLQKWENCKSHSEKKLLLGLFLLAGTIGFAFDFSIGVHVGRLMQDSTRAYYYLMSIFR